MTQETTPELTPNDLVEVRLVGRIGSDGQGPEGHVHVIVSDGFGHEKSLILKRQWLREVRADA